MVCLSCRQVVARCFPGSTSLLPRYNTVFVGSAIIPGFLKHFKPPRPSPGSQGSSRIITDLQGIAAVLTSFIPVCQGVHVLNRGEN